MAQEPLQNPIEILFEFWVDCLSILAPFWLPKLLQNGSKSDLKNVQKKERKIIEKWSKNGSKNEAEPRIPQRMLTDTAPEVGQAGV